MVIFAFSTCTLETWKRHFYINICPYHCRVRCWVKFCADEGRYIFYCFQFRSHFDKETFMRAIISFKENSKWDTSANVSSFIVEVKWVRFHYRIDNNNKKISFLNKRPCNPSILLPQTTHAPIYVIIILCMHFSPHIYTHITCSVNRTTMTSVNW